MNRKWHSTAVLVFIVLSCLSNSELNAQSSELDLTHSSAVAIRWNASIPEFAISPYPQKEIFIYNSNLMEIAHSGTTPAYAHSLDWNWDNTLLASGIDAGNEGYVQIWNGSLQLLKTNSLFRFSTLAWSPKENILAVGDGEQVLLWQITSSSTDTTVTLIGSLDIAEKADSIESINWNPNGTQLAIVYSSGMLRLWDIQQLGSPILERRGLKHYFSAAWKPFTGNQLAVYDAEGNNLELWNTLDADFPIISTIPGDAIGTSLEHIVWGKGGLATYDVKAYVTLWNLSSNTILRNISLDGRVQYMEWSPDGSQLVYIARGRSLEEAVGIVPNYVVTD